MNDVSFFQKVYRIVSLVPPGKVATYGQIAFLLGSPRAGRTVGWAMRAAPHDVPAHRVVNKSGTLAPEYVFGGADMQRARLEEEGVTFTPEGTIDMKKHLWIPEMDKLF